MSTSAPAGFDIATLKRNVIAYWLKDLRMNDPVKAVSAQQAAR
jgi:hypothetical protein